MKEDTNVINFKKKKKKRQRISAKIRRKMENKRRMLEAPRHNWRQSKI